MKKNTRWISIPLIISLIIAPVANAITIKEEKELSEKIMTIINMKYPLIKDPIVDKYINELGFKILSHVPSQPFSYRFHVVHEDVYNAFAIPAGQIFIHSGLLEALESEEELAGILAHEIAHAACRHLSQRIEQSKKVNLATLAGVVAGVLLGVSGKGTASNAAILGSFATNKTLALSYTRENERQADQLGLGYLRDAGYSGMGLLTSMQKLRSKQWFGSEQVPSYLMTHPASEERMAYIDGWLSRNEKKSQPPKTKPSEQPQTFQRVQTRITALYNDTDIAVKKFRTALDKNPDNPMAHYGYGLTLARMRNYDEAVSHFRTALKKNALDPYYLSAIGNVYYHQGHYDEAIKTLKSAVSIAQDEPEALLTLGRAHIKIEKPEEATQILEKLVKQHPDYSQGYYFLGEAYGKKGNMPEAHYNLGLYYDKKFDSKNAVFHLQRASKSITDPDRSDRIKELLKKNLEREKVKQQEKRKKK